MCLFFTSLTLLWLKLDRSPPAWDDAFYLTNSLVLYDALTEHGIAGLAARFVTAMGSKPPVIALLPAPLYLIFGRRQGVAYLVNILALLCVFAVLYRLGRRYSGERAGLIAVYAAGTMPMLYGLSRWYLVETALTAIVCAVICLAAELDQSSGARRASLLGAVCGLGLLTKMSFPVYVVTPLLYFAVRDRRTFGGRVVAAILLSAALLALPWYAVNTPTAVQLALRAGSVSAAAAYGTGEILSAGAIKQLFINLFNVGPLLYFLVAGALWFTVTGSRRIQGLRLCALWAAPVLILVFSHYRDLRYAAPLYPALALALGIVLDAVIEKYGQAAAVGTCLLLMLPLGNMLQVSFGLFGQPLELGGLLFYWPRFSYARRYATAAWPHGEILADIQRLSGGLAGKSAALILGTDSPRFNADNLLLAARAGHFPFEVTTTTHETDEAAMPALLDTMMYFVHKEGGESEAKTFNPLGDLALRHVRESGRFVELPIARKLPDGGVAHVYANRSAGSFEQSRAFLGSGLETVAERHIVFDDRLRLSGFSVERTADRLEATYRWQCLQRLDRAYWCFTHILDSAGSVIGYLDHEIMNGQPPTSAWSPGDTAIERLVFRFTKPQPGPVRLRLGVYDRISGDRLSITAADAPFADNRTAVIVAP